MERTYCDHCGVFIDTSRVILKNWIAYYDTRLDESFSYSYGNKKQTLCNSCLNDVLPIFNRKIVREPAIEPAVFIPAPVNEGCSDCWICRLKRRFKGK